MPDVVGYRFWRLGVDRQGPALWSLIVPFCWSQRVVGPASIDADGGSWSPHPQGLYAFSERGSIDERFGGGHLAGLVHLWGNVAVHERGYRAEWAEVVEIWPRTRCILCRSPGSRLVLRAWNQPGHILCDEHGLRCDGLPLTDVFAALSRRYDAPAVDGLAA